MNTFWINAALFLLTLICAARVLVYLADEWSAWRRERREAEIAERFRNEATRAGR